MKKRMRSFLLIIFSVFAILALAFVDITSNGILTTGFWGMVVLLLGAIIIPTIMNLLKENKK